MISLLSILLFALTAIWIAAGSMIAQTKFLSSHLRVPTFSFSLLLLGALTSIPEVLVAINATIVHQPEISLGNLIGGQVILMLCVLPLLALRKGGLRFYYPLQPRTIALTLGTISLPFVALLNHTASLIEASVLLLSFLLFTLVFAVDLKREHTQLAQAKKNGRSATISLKVLRSLVIIVIAVGIVFLASNRLVYSVSELALLLGMDSFFVSLFVTAIGTNIPEITLALRALVAKKSEVALGDYFGSAAINTGIFAAVVFANSSITLAAPVLSLSIPLLGFGLFWWFARSKRTLSFFEALTLLGVFFLFLAVTVGIEVQ